MNHVNISETTNYYNTTDTMKKSIFTIIPMALLASCSSELSETTDNAVKGGDVEKVSIVSHPFVFDDDTRTSLTATDNSISFAWADYDALGVFPIAPTTNNQARQALSVPADCETDAHYASFDGAGWELKKGNTYAAYCPYNGSLPAETPYTEVPIDMTGQDGTLATIGQEYDFMYAPSSFAEVTKDDHKHEVVFDFQHAIAILQLKLTMPVAATWKSLTLASEDDNKVFVTSATMDVATGVVTPVEISSKVTLLLNNVSTTATDKTLTLYLAVLPTTTGDLILTAKTSANKSFTSAITGKALVAGKAYRFTTSPVAIPTGNGYENGYAYVDLGLPSGLKWATMNVGASSVTDYGKYYAWGETKAYGEEDQTNARNYAYAGSYTKTYYDWNTYKWSDDDYGDYFSKYTGKNNITLDAEDDAATQNWGGAWRMPTHYERNELVKNCYWVWTSSYNGSGVAGYIVYAAKSSSDKGQVVYNGNTPSSDYSLSDSHIFLPAAGCHFRSWLSDAGTDGYYWFSTNSDNYGIYAWDMEFYSGSYIIYFRHRLYGQSVRAVCE